MILSSGTDVDDGEVTEVAIVHFATLCSSESFDMGSRIAEQIFYYSFFL